MPTIYSAAGGELGQKISVIGWQRSWRVVGAGMNGPKSDAKLMQP